MRILERLDQLAALGDRIGYSPEEDAAHADRLVPRGGARDRGRRRRQPDRPHPRRRARGLDGLAPRHRSRRGPFRRTLGVVAGLEAVERLGHRARRRRLPGRGARLRRRASTARPDAYVEHIEQGPTLLQADAPLGVVTAIVGYVRPEDVRRHAGARGHDPDGRSRDALVAAAEYVLHARDARAGSTARVDDRPGDGRAGRDERDPRPRRRVGPSARSTRSASTGSRPRSEIEEPVRPSRRRWRRRSGPALRAEVEAVGAPVLELLLRRGTTPASLQRRRAGMLFVRSSTAASVTIPRS